MFSQKKSPKHWFGGQILPINEKDDTLILS